MTRRNLSPPLLAARWLLAQDTPDPSTRDAALKFGVDELRVIDHMESLRETGEPARDTSKPATLPRHSRKLRTSGKDAKRWQKKELVKLYRMRKRNIPWERIAKSLKRPEEMCKEMYAKSLDHSGDAEDSLDREHDPADLDLDAQSTTNRRLTWSPFWCVHSKSFQGNLKGHVPKSSDYQSAIPFLKYGQEVLFKGDAYAFQHNGWQCGTKLIGITDLGHGLSRQDYNKTLEAALSCVTEAPCVALTPASLCSFLGLTVHPSLAQRLARLVNTTPISGQLEPTFWGNLRGQD
ncbi:hypothetical protein QBC40DRAFT_327318 [Triangularia verruculosa]|uniref:Uncharacterized protein n=1 Tax=Triangularia verruculosa TaxID=2587418 RepID=A0AAN6XQD0_9PEZI|nr:hypothetical protein QBC40DRAFT_327318 [Triangularia verruculosa]